MSPFTYTEICICRVGVELGYLSHFTCYNIWQVQNVGARQVWRVHGNFLPRGKVRSVRGQSAAAAVSLSDRRRLPLSLPTPCHLTLTSTLLVSLFKNPGISLPQL